MNGTIQIDCHHVAPVGIRLIDETSRDHLEPIAFDQVHLIKGDRQHDQRFACPESPSIWFRLKAIRFSPRR